MKSMFLRHLALAVSALSLGTYQPACPRGETIIITGLGIAITVEPLINSNKRKAFTKDFFKNLFTAKSDAQKVAFQILVGGILVGCGLYKMRKKNQQQTDDTAITTPAENHTPTELPTALKLFTRSPESFKDTKTPDSLAVRWPDTLTTKDWDVLTVTCKCCCFRIRPKAAKKLLTLIDTNHLAPEYMRTSEEKTFLFAKKSDGNRYLYIVNNSEKHSGTQECAYDFMAAAAQDHSSINMIDGGVRSGEDIKNTLMRTVSPTNKQNDELRDDWKSYDLSKQSTTRTDSHSTC